MWTSCSCSCDCWSKYCVYVIVCCLQGELWRLATVEVFLTVKVQYASQCVLSGIDYRLPRTWLISYHTTFDRTAHYWCVGLRMVEMWFSVDWRQLLLIKPCSVWVKRDNLWVTFANGEWIDDETVMNYCNSQLTTDLSIGHWSLARFPMKTLVLSLTCGTSVAYLVRIGQTTVVKWPLAKESNKSSLSRFLTNTVVLKIRNYRSTITSNSFTGKVNTRDFSAQSVTDTHCLQSPLSSW